MKPYDILCPMGHMHCLSMYSEDTLIIPYLVQNKLVFDQPKPRDLEMKQRGRGKSAEVTARLVITTCVIVILMLSAEQSSAEHHAGLASCLTCSYFFPSLFVLSCMLALLGRRGRRWASVAFLT